VGGDLTLLTGLHIEGAL